MTKGLTHESRSKESVLRQSSLPSSHMRAPIITLPPSLTPLPLSFPPLFPLFFSSVLSPSRLLLFNHIYISFLLALTPPSLPPSLPPLPPSLPPLQVVRYRLGSELPAQTLRNICQSISRPPSLTAPGSEGGGKEEGGGKGEDGFATFKGPRP